MTRRLTALASAAALGLFALTACGGGTTTSPSSPTPSSGGAAPKADLAVAQSGSLGLVVTDAQGRTLYRFDRDTAKPPASNCSGQCASVWPPAVTSSAAPSAQGIDQSLVGTITRADGAKQLTLAGWPLYRFAQDTAAGQTHGQGVVGFGAAWFAVTPQGEKAATPPSAPSSGGGGYGY